MITFSKLIKSISKSEWKLIFFVSIILIVFFHLPNIYFYFFGNNNYLLSGLRGLTPVDVNVYHSYINQIKNGSTLLFNQYSIEPQAMGTFNIFWYFSGNLAKIFNLSATSTLTLIRVLLIPIFTIISYLFISYFFENKLKRAWSLILTMFGSGMGAYFGFMNSVENLTYMRPYDLWIPESTFFNTLYNPHFILATCGILMSLLMFIMAIENQKYRYSIIGGFMALVLFNFHPYHLPIIYFVPLTYCLYLLISKEKNFNELFWHYLIFCIITTPAIIYHFFTMTDPVIGARATQNITLSSPLIYFIIGMGIYLWFGFGGMIKYFKTSKNYPSYFIFLFIWICFAILTTKNPFWQFQRRNIQGIFLPLVIFSVEYVYLIYRDSTFLKKLVNDLNYPIVTAIIFINVLAPTSFYNVFRDIDNVRQERYLYYITKNKMEVFEELNKFDQAIILSSNINSSFITAHTKHTVFIGHDHESIHSTEKKQLARDLFTNNLSEEESIRKLKDINVKYLYWDFIDHHLWPEYHPEEKKYWRKINTNNNYKIFEFIDRENAVAPEE